MFGLKTLFMYIIILGLIGGAGYLYYTDTQKRLKVAAERNATLMLTKEIQASTIQKINEDLERSQLIVQQLRDKFAGLRIIMIYKKDLIRTV